MTGLAGRLALAAAALSVAGCDMLTAASTRAARADTRFEYRTRLDRQDDRRDMAIAVENRGAGLDDVREAVRFEATRYCLQTFGSSDTAWQTDPATGDWAYATDGARLLFRARCTGGA